MSTYRRLAAALPLLITLACADGTAPAPAARERDGLRLSHVPAPASVTLTGSFSQELGCSGDWDPFCTVPDLTYDPYTDVWKARFLVPAGTWQYLAVLDRSFTFYSGQGGLAGPPIDLVLGADAVVTFIYDHKTHVVTGAVMPLSVSLPGDFGQELGCAGDWQPDCHVTGLAYDAATNTWRNTFTVPAGSWQYKVTIDDSWSENYGENGAPNGANIPLGLNCPAPVTFTYDPVTHRVSTSSGVPACLSPSTVRIDVAPKSASNVVSISGGSKVFAIAVFSEVGFDATTIDPASVRLGSTGLALERSGAPQIAFTDVDGDGKTDATLYFNKAAAAANFDLHPVYTSLTVTGTTATGLHWSGTDAVTVVP